MDVTQQLLFHCTFIWSLYFDNVNTETSPQKTLEQSISPGHLKLPQIDALKHHIQKRASYSEEDVNDKRAWNNNMRVWGKRDSLDKRGWNNNMRVWGKRDTLPEKKWDQRMRVWGKRDEMTDGEDKRAWNNNMRVWGKRDDDEYNEEKKAWNNNMRVWGKRDVQTSDKRAWNNNMRVWGKRDSSSALDEDFLKNLLDKVVKSDKIDSSVEKRWFTYPTLDFDHSGKRTWRTNTMRVWGKRSA